MGNINSILIIISWILVVLAIAGFCRRIFPNQKELSRKIVHIGTGPVIPLAWLLEIPTTVATSVATLITICLIINNRLRLLPALEDINRQSYGTIAYGFSITFLLIFFWPEHAAAVSTGVLVMAFGDGFAGLIGRQVNSPSWTVFRQRKSTAGTLTMALMGVIVVTLISKLSGFDLHPLQILLISCIGVALEQLSLWGIDNITVPIGVTCSVIWLNS